MAKEIIGKKTKKVEIISDEVWDNLVGRGWDKSYDMTPIVERKLREVPVINKPIEITKKKISKNG